MDTSFFAAGPISWPALIAFALFLFALGRVADWIGAKFKAGTDKAVSPLTVDMAAVKIQLASQADQLSEFKIEVARTYATNEVIHRLERRMDDIVASVRNEMRETRDVMIRAFTERRPPG